MGRYLRVSEQQLPPGRSALLLFVAGDTLCAGILRHGCDGRFHRQVPERPGPEDLLPTIRRLMQRPDDDLLVVIEPAAYWPECFPALEVLGG